MVIGRTIAVVGAAVGLVVALGGSATPAHANNEGFRIFGSAGAESLLTPANERSSLNPGNVGGVHYRTASGDASIFMEQVPKSRKWKARIKVRTDGTERAGSRVEVGEALLQRSVTSWLDLSAGRIIDRWGTGYAWNPTGFVSPRKNPSDPSDRRSSNRGLDMVRADLFVKGTNISLYGLRGGATAARAYRLVRGTDISLHLFHNERGTRAGVSVARVFGDALELHGEVARSDSASTERDGAVVSAVAGGQFTFRNGTNMVVEVFHSGEGLSPAEWEQFQNVATKNDAASLLAANHSYQPLKMGREYAFVRLAIPQGGTGIDWEVVSIINLGDGSGLVRGMATLKLRQSVSAYLIDTEFFGGTGSELSYIQVRRATTIGVRLWF
ncbi:MAG TPA: hypothetical protein VHL58_18835 [Thermoanaerobaculia bacterium]|nr:hypothetical protein [Thermoanaerobaculia bacterium]